MFLKIEDIGPAGLKKTESVGHDIVTGWLGNDSVYTCRKGCTVDLTAERMGHDVLVRGHCIFTLNAECSSCLKDVEVVSDIPFTVLFSERTNAVGNTGSDDGNDEIVYFSGPILELEGPVKESLLLNLPMAPRCSEECRGLCPICGEDKNIKDCRCNEKNLPLSAVLKKRGGKSCVK